MARARGKLPAFNSQALSNFIFGLNKMQFDPGTDFMADFFAQCRARMPAFTPAGFASMLHSTARLGYWPGAPFMAAFEAEVLGRGLDAFTRGELWKLVHGLATLRSRPSDAFLAAYFRAFQAKAGSGVGAGKLTVKDVSLVLWSMAALDAGPAHAPALAALVDAAAGLVARHQLDPQGDEYASRSGGDDPAVLKYRQLVQASLYLRSLGDPALDAALARLDAALQAVWHPKEEQLKKKQQEAGGAPLSVTAAPTPTFHGAVLELLEESGVRAETGTLDDVFNLELLLFPREQPTDPGEKPVVLLLEGRGHFFTNALSRQTGDAEFRRRLVAHAAEAEGRFRAVGQVTIWEWRAAKSRAARLRLLRSRLGSLGVDPDAYIAAPTKSRAWAWEEGEEDGQEDGQEAAEGGEDRAAACSGNGNGPVHHVAAELVVDREAHAPAAAPASVPRADIEIKVRGAPMSLPRTGPVPPTRKGHGGHSHQQRRGGKRRFVAAAIRAASAEGGAEAEASEDGAAALE